MRLAQVEEATAEILKKNHNVSQLQTLFRSPQTLLSEALLCDGDLPSSDKSDSIPETFNVTNGHLAAA